MEKFINTKQKGNIAVGLAIAYYTSEGYTDSIPLNDSQDYDLIVDIDGLLNKIQVKYTSEKADSGYYKVGLRSISGSSKLSYKTVSDTEIDYLFIVTANRDQYILPLLDIITISTITLNDKLDQYKLL